MTSHNFTSCAHVLFQAGGVEEEVSTDIHHQRLLRLRYHCPETAASHKRNITGLNLSNLYVDDKHKLIYCHISKVGSSNLKRVFAVLTRLLHNKIVDPLNISSTLVHGFKFKKLSDFKPAEIENKLDTYYKFMFVREPLERLWSAYVDKFHLPPAWDLAAQWIKDNRQWADAKSKECGHDMTFIEFLQLAIEASVERRRDVGSDHWVPFHQICHPCAIQYDALGKLETFMEDLIFILQSRNLDKLVDLSRMSTQGNHIKDRIEKDIQRLFGNDLHLLEKYSKVPLCVSLKELVNRLWASFIFHGYLPSKAAYPKVLLEGTSFTENQLIELFLEYYQKWKEQPSAEKESLTLKETMISQSLQGLGSHTLLKFLDEYQQDYFLFGYEFPDYLIKLMNSIQRQEAKDVVIIQNKL